MSNVIRPFQRQGHYTVFDNALLDYVMPSLTPNGWKVLSFIIRKTIGWQKAEDALSYSQIMDGTGIASRSTVKKALGELAEAELILVQATEKRWSAYRYQLNTGYEIAIGTENVLSNSTENVLGVGTENVLGAGTENGHTKEKEEKKTNGGDDYPAVVSTWENEMGYLVTPIISDYLREAMGEFGSDGVIRAIGIASAANARTLSYVKGIFRKVRENGWAEDRNKGSRANGTGASHAVAIDDQYGGFSL